MPKKPLIFFMNFLNVELWPPLWKGGSDTSSDLVETFLTWANCNLMSCNPNKCKELVKKKKENSRFPSTALETR